VILSFRPATTTVLLVTAATPQSGRHHSRRHPARPLPPDKGDRRAVMDGSHEDDYERALLVSPALPPGDDCGLVRA